MLPADWFSPELVLLTILTARAFWGWYYGREHADQRHGQTLRKHEQEMGRLRERAYGLANDLGRLTVQVAVLDNRVQELRERVGAVESRMYRREGT